MTGSAWPFIGMIVGFFIGVVMTSLAISWHAQERDSHIIRLQQTIDILTSKIKEKMKNDADDTQ